MKYVIGVDCGGTNTIAEAFSVTGESLVKKRAGSGNVIIDYSNSLLHIRQALSDIFLTIAIEECQLLVLGIAGLDSGSILKDISEEFNDYSFPVVIINDGQLAHYATLKGEDGSLIIAGTGSIAIGKKDLNWYRVGGWGHLFGDQGSAYWIATKAIQQVLLDYDLGNQTRLLTTTVFDFFSVKNVFELTKIVYNLPKRELAKLAVVVDDLASIDENAQTILIVAGTELAQMVVSLNNKMSISSSELAVGLSGSVLENNKIVQASFEKKLSTYFPTYKKYKKDYSCTKGAYYYYKEMPVMNNR